MKGGRPLYVLGLSALNLQRLREGKPITIELEALGGVGEVLLFAGENEADMARDLAALIGPNTQVRGIKESGH